MQNQVAVITGGGTGLGKEIAKQYVLQGARVVICSRNPDHLAAGKEEIQSLGGEVLTYQVDVREPKSIEEMKDSIIEQWGRIDILVNNAAGNFIYPAEKLPLKGWKSVIDIVLNGSFYCSQIIGNWMIESNHGGQIINILATYAWTGGPGTIHSACAKAGVLAMTRTLAVEWARYGIRVNAVAPGPFDTEGARQRLWPTQEMQQAITREIPAGRFATPEEVARAILFLSSPYADYITGECLTIDGGAWLGKGIGKVVEHLEDFEKMRMAAKKSKHQS
ncbi:MAG: 2,4-dienoyl-CoA reductase [Calditrichaeota bacterium]|nr:MAG: 2,4-dienoyl-CoA reductase [Calditrichota bacterium]